MGLIDLYDLYGKVAYPKHHTSQQVAQIYRLAAASGGVFVNPALTEPFGLTLIEAAASGLPVVATEDGGPIDIVGNCENGILVNPLDTEQIAAAILQILSNWEDWQQRSVNGLRGVRESYSWKAHAKSYLDIVQPIIDKTEVLVRPPTSRRPCFITTGQYLLTWIKTCWVTRSHCLLWFSYCVIIASVPHLALRPAPTGFGINGDEATRNSGT